MTLKYKAIQKGIVSSLYLFAVAVMIFLLTFEVLFALTPPVEDTFFYDTEELSAYRKYKSVENISLSVPTVVEVPFTEPFLERYDFAVIDTDFGTFEPSLFIREVNEVPVTPISASGGTSPHRMTDGNQRTYTEFSLPENAQGKASIVLRSQKAITSSSLAILLDNHVALPKTVKITARVGSENKIVVGEKALNSQTIRFPKTTSSEWRVDLTYSQPLRITELKLAQEDVAVLRTQALRFLAQPGRSYRIYFDSDRIVRLPVGESGNLSLDRDVKRLPAGISMSNEYYRQADVDGDGVPDTRDNCVSVSNSDQLDINLNGRGDACDDFDRDGIINSNDNCQDQPNRSQRDEDGDGIGDVCDGEESRITERYAWIPWVGIGAAAAVLIGLLSITAYSMRHHKIEVVDDETPPSEN